MRVEIFLNGVWLRGGGENDGLMVAWMFSP